MKDITSYKDINELLEFLCKNLQDLFGENLIGIYLTGSLTYDDFNPGRSDIDLAVILKKPAAYEEIDKIKIFHKELGHKFPKWEKRLECSYIPLEMLGNILPPKEPRPYFGEGIFYPEAPYGNEWLINNYLLYKYGTTLYGQDIKTIIDPVGIEDVKKACIRDLHKEWEPKINDREWLSNSHYQSYLVLNLCRILYTVLQNDVASKSISAEWSKSEFPQYQVLIEEAEAWDYGKEMSKEKETVEFIKFTIDKVGV